MPPAISNLVKVVYNHQPPSLHHILITINEVNHFFCGYVLMSNGASLFLVYFGHQNTIATSSNRIFFIHQWIFTIGYLLREMTVKHTIKRQFIVMEGTSTTVKVSRVIAPKLVSMTTTKQKQKKNSKNNKTDRNLPINTPTSSK